MPSRLQKDDFSLRCYLASLPVSDVCRVHSNHDLVYEYHPHHWRQCRYELGHGTQWLWLMGTGIGAAFAKRLHSEGKKVIVTGRNRNSLQELKSSLKGIETYEMDMARLDRLGDDLSYLLNAYPEIDTIWVNGGIQYSSKIQDPSTSSDEDIQAEVNINLTAPLIIGRHAVPLLLAKKKETTLMFTSSGLAFIPNGPAFLVYPATKAAVHHYCVGLRQVLKDSTVHVLELAPPYTATGLNAAHREVSANVPCMRLDDFVDESFKLMEGRSSKELKEIAPGSAGPRAGLWRETMGKRMSEMGFSD